MDVQADLHRPQKKPPQSLTNKDVTIKMSSRPVYKYIKFANDNKKWLVDINGDEICKLGNFRNSGILSSGRRCDMSAQMRYVA